MRRVEVGCDRCRGPVADGDGGVLVVVAGPRSLPWPTCLASGRPAIDLCGQCLGAMTDWLRSHPVDVAPAQRATRGHAPSEGETDPGAGAGAAKDADGRALEAQKGGSR